MAIRPRPNAEQFSRFVPMDVGVLARASSFLPARLHRCSGSESMAYAAIARCQDFRSISAQGRRTMLWITRICKPAIVAGVVLAASLAASPAFAVVGLGGVTLLEPCAATETPTILPVPNPSTYESFDNGSYDGGWRNTQHTVWAVTVYATNSWGQSYAATYYVSTYDWNGLCWLYMVEDINQFYWEI